MHSRLSARKRKLLYDQNEDDEPPVDGFNSPNKTSCTEDQGGRKHNLAPSSRMGQDWKQCGEGFSDLELGNRKEGQPRSRSAKKLRITEMKLDEGLDHPDTGADLFGAEINWDSNSDDEVDGPPLPREITPLGTSPGTRTRVSSRKQSPKKTASNSKCSLASKLLRHARFDACDVEIVDLNVDGKASPLEENSKSNQNEGRIITEAQNSKEGCISLFDSDDEDSQALKNEMNRTDRETQDVSQEISVASSSTSSSDIPPSQTASRIKAGDWLKNVQWQETSPCKTSLLTTEDKLEDSAKKKKKYKRNTMAEQLHKLVSREKSAQTVWYHRTKETSADPSQESSKVLTACVLSVEVTCSLCVARCSVTNERLTDDDNIDQPCDLCESPFKQLLFSNNNNQLRNIKPGTTVAVHPPWQTVDIPLVGEVLLCTYYTVIDRTPVAVQPCSPSAKASLPSERSCTAQWICPCVQDGISDPSCCLAQRNPCHTSLETFIQSTVGQGSSTDARKEEVPSCSSVLHTILASQGRARTVSESILETLEKTGHSTTKALQFKSKMRRVFCKRPTDSNVLSWSVLVEDSYGVFALVSLPDNAARLETWRDVVDQGEGRTAIFSGVTLQSRTNKDKNPSLFSVVDAVWTCTSGQRVVRQTSTEDSGSQVEGLSRPSPGFCYLMTTWQGTSSVRILSEFTAASGNPSGMEGVELKKVYDLQVSNTDQDDRLSFTCKVVHFVEESSPHEHCLSVYVTDPSLLSDAMPRSLCLSVVRTSPLSVEKLMSGQILYGRDIHLHDGKLLVDEYSRVVVGTANLPESYFPSNVPSISEEIFQRMAFTPEPLVPIHRVHSLVTIHGRICDVDEASSYVWQECDKCSSDGLIVNSSLQKMQCMSCQSVVDEPVTRMRMGVTVKCPGMGPDNCVNVKLLHSTVESLLSTEDQEEEGYDISCVMGKLIGPLPCIIREKQTSRNKASTTFILQEIKLS